MDINTIRWTYESRPGERGKMISLSHFVDSRVSSFLCLFWPTHFIVRRLHGKPPRFSIRPRAPFSWGSPHGWIGGGSAWKVAIRDWLHRVPLLFLAASACLGVWCDITLHPPTFVVVLVFGVLLFGILQKHLITRTVATVLMLIPLGAMHHRAEQIAFESKDILQHVHPRPQPAVLDVIVDRPLQVRLHPLSAQRRAQGLSPYQTQFEAVACQYRRGNSFAPTSGRVLVTIDERVHDIQVGEKCRLYGSIHRPSAPGNPGQRDRRSMYRRRCIHALIRIQDGDAIDRMPRDHDATTIWQSLHRFNDRVSLAARQSLQQHLDPETYPLAMAMVLGQRELVEDFMRDQLLVTGTAHLLSISGLHLAIVASLVHGISMLLGIPRFPRILLLLVVCGAYTSITGGRPPVVRATVLIAVLSMSWLTFRTPSPLNALGLSALFLLYGNPKLIDSVGVHLSFLAVATLLILGSRSHRSSSRIQDEIRIELELDKMIQKSTSGWSFRVRRWNRNLLRACRYSLAVTIVCGPLVWYQFNIISPISVLANVSLGPLMYVGLTSGLATIACDWVVPTAAIFPGTVCEFSLRGMQKLLAAAASVPGGHIWLPSPPKFWVMVFYLGLLFVGLVWTIHSRTENFDRGKSASSKGLVRFRFRGFAATLGALWFGMAWCMATNIPSLPRGVSEALFVDVGHGTAVILRDHSDQVWLYDCGHLGNDSGNSHGIQDALWFMGVTQIEGVMISHADADHFNALPSILSRFGVKKIYTPPGMLDEPEDSVRVLRRAIVEKGVPVKEIARNEQLQLGQFSAQVAHPPTQRLKGSDNANSLVIILHAGRDIVLPGDLEPPGTQTLTNQPRPKAGSIVMAPHHGSLHAMAESVLYWARPAVVVISGGRRTESPAVIQELGGTGAQVIGTHMGGAIRIQVGKQTDVGVRAWKSDPW